MDKWSEATWYLLYVDTRIKLRRHLLTEFEKCRFVSAELVDEFA